MKATMNVFCEKSPHNSTKAVLTQKMKTSAAERSDFC